MVGPAGSVVLVQPPSGTTGGDAEVVFWQSIATSMTPVDYQAYLRQSPNGSFTELARARAASATAPQQQAMTAPPAQTLRPMVPNAAGYPVGVGQSFRDCSNCPEMVVIPEGSFTMGSSQMEISRDGIPHNFADRERPQHDVRVGSPLAVGKYHVTRSEFARFVQASGYSASPGCYILDSSRKYKHDAARSCSDPGFPQSDRNPVVSVNSCYAKAYVEWLFPGTGRGYP